MLHACSFSALYCIFSPHASSQQQLKRKVDECQAKLSQAKAEYRAALRNLETISDEIHARRRLAAMGPRGCGVGAEKDVSTGDDISNFKMESDGLSSEFSKISRGNVVVVYKSHGIHNGNLEACLGSDAGVFLLQ